jgi:DNA-binding NarL/FixJ family response regulator
VKILVVARIPVIREGLRGLLATESDFAISTIAPSSGARGLLIERILSEQPDVLLMDVDVLEREGWVLLGDLDRVAPYVRSLVISDSPTDRRVAQALSLGARGYLLRDSAPEEMVAAIRAAHAGVYVLHSMAAETLVTPWLEQTAESDDPYSDEAHLGSENKLIEPLSARELDVLRLMTRGMANKQIAAELFVTEHTVKFHIRSILGKLGAANRTEAVTLSLQKGLVTL